MLPKTNYNKKFITLIENKSFQQFFLKTNVSKSLAQQELWHTDMHENDLHRCSTYQTWVMYKYLFPI